MELIKLQTMKKMIIMLLAMTAVWSACTKVEEEPEYFNIDSTDIVLQTSEAGQTDILLSTNRDPVATVDAAAEEWLSAEISRRCLTLVYSENTVSEQRTGTVSVTAGSFQIDVTLTQAAYTKPEPEPDPDEPGEVTSYEVYDVYYENGEAAGIVFWASDDHKSALVVSLDRTPSLVPWSYDNTVAVGTGQSDGAANTELIRASSIASQTPAIDFCDAHGEGWYWPAMDEMMLLFEAYNGSPYTEGKHNVVPAELPDEQKAARAAFDELLTSNGGTAMNTAAETEIGDKYWTSTEQSKDGVVYGSTFRFGKAYASGGGDTQKKEQASSYVRVIKAVSLNGSTPDPDPDDPDVPVETEFPVYQEGGKNIGIVYWTSEDGKTSKVLSLARTESIPWSYNGSAFLGAADEDDGAANTEILKASAEAADIPALAFCESLGEGWYWPALNEMVEIFDIYNGVPYAELEENKATATPDKITDEEKASRDAFDLSLTTYGGTAMNTADPTTKGDRYWTSTELTDGDKHYGSFMTFGKAYKSYPADTPGKTNASGGRYARCIKVITNE